MYDGGANMTDYNCYLCKYVYIYCYNIIYVPPANIPIIYNESFSFNQST